MSAGEWTFLKKGILDLQGFDAHRFVKFTDFWGFQRFLKSKSLNLTVFASENEIFEL